MARPAVHFFVLALALAFVARTAAADAETPPRLESALQLLESVPEGAPLARYLRRNRIPLRFGSCSVRLENAQASACFDHRRRVISISPAHQGAPLDFLAALIAHEATHAERSVEAQLGYLFRPQPEARMRLMIAEEAVAYRVQVQVWRALRQNRGAFEDFFSAPDMRVLAMNQLARRMERQATEAELVQFIAKQMGYGAYYNAKPTATEAGSR